MRKFIKKVSKHSGTKAPNVYCTVPNSMYMRLQLGTKVYQDESGKYLPDAQQPKPKNPHNYIPHQSTRYKNINLGNNGKAQATKFSKGPDGVFASTLVETDKQLPHLYDKRSDCCGCAACYTICPVRGFLANGGMDSIGEVGEKYSLPHGAIYMEEDEEGFQYPIIDASLCIRCYKCVDVCPIRTADKEKGIEFEIWGSKRLVEL